MDGVKIVSQALLNTECKTVLVGGKPYFIKPPTIRRIAGAGLALSGDDGADILTAMKDSERAATALSWFVCGNDSLAETFKDASLSDVVNALESAMSLIDIRDFQKLSDLSRSVRHLIANLK